MPTANRRRNPPRLAGLCPAQVTSRRTRSPGGLRRGASRPATSYSADSSQQTPGRDRGRMTIPADGRLPRDLRRNCKRPAVRAQPLRRRATQRRKRSGAGRSSRSPRPPGRVEPRAPRCRPALACPAPVQPAARPASLRISSSRPRPVASPAKLRRHLESRHDAGIGRRAARKRRGSPVRIPPPRQIGNST